MNKNKTYPYLLVALLMLGSIMLTACKPQSRSEQAAPLSIVVASYPEYDWLCQIIGKENSSVKVKLLMDGGVDLHSYEPNIQDIAAITEADLFIYNGGSSYKWVDRVLSLKANKDRKVLNLLESLSEQRELPQGESCHHEHETCCDHDHDHDHDHDVADEHIWLSLRNAVILSGVIEQELSALVPTQAAQFQANAQAYIAQLKALDARYASMVQQAGRDAIIIADRFPFSYMMQDYGIKYHAAFQGCSAETEASFETIRELTEDMRELSPKVILILKGGMRQLAQTLISNSAQTQCQILEMNDLHSVSPASRAQGEDYASIMEANLKVLEVALAP